MIRPLVPIEGRDALHDDEMSAIAWAEVYPTEDAARRKALRAAGAPRRPI